MEILERERTNAKPSYHDIDMGNSCLFFQVFHINTSLANMSSPFFMSGKLENKKSKSKETLLRSCVKLLSTQLWDNISIDDIEKYIHKTRGSIFHHYKTKDELFSDAIKYFFAKSNLLNIINKEPVCMAFLCTLKDEFGVENPEKALLNLWVQACYKGINFSSNPFVEIAGDDINREKIALGEILLHILTK